MRPIALALVATAALLVAGHAARASDRVAGAGALPGDAAIKITINPEGRVSVTFEGPLPPPAPQGTPIAFDIKIVNQGFSTARLEARLVGAPAPGAILDFRPEPLRGIPEETRTMRITLTGRAQTDLTIAFRLQHEEPDLGGRDRIHLLMRGL
jgi:hypothetical protein